MQGRGKHLGVPCIFASLIMTSAAHLFICFVVQQHKYVLDGSSGSPIMMETPELLTILLNPALHL